MDWTAHDESLVEIVLRTKARWALRKRFRDLDVEDVFATARYLMLRMKTGFRERNGCKWSSYVFKYLANELARELEHYPFIGFAFPKQGWRGNERPKTLGQRTEGPLTEGPAPWTEQPVSTLDELIRREESARDEALVASLLARVGCGSAAEMMMKPMTIKFLRRTVNES